MELPLANDEKKPIMSAERDERGNEYLDNVPWTRMGARTATGRAQEYLDTMINKVRDNFGGEDFVRVVWLSSTLFFIVGGYWLLRSLKDPIMSSISGVEYIPQAKIVSLFAVFACVAIYNKLLDMMPKHHLFYLMGATYGGLFFIMGLLLYHPTIGLPNTKADPSRLLGWVSYVTIESFGSMVIQAYWALVNASVDVGFGKRNFGYIIAGAQIGSILGPTIATQSDRLGVPVLYLSGSVVMFCIISVMHLYISRFGVPDDNNEDSNPTTQSSTAAAASSSNIGDIKKPISNVGGKTTDKKEKKKGGMMEGFYLLAKYEFVQGIFFISSLFMVNVTVIDYMMKVLAKERYAEMYPEDPQAATSAFAAFMGYFGQMTNSISFLFSLFGTKSIIEKLGFSKALLSFPTLLLVCTVVLWFMPNIWVVFVVMMIIKGMSYALNNPTKEILYQSTSSSIKFKCKSWIDTFGQRGAKAGGSLITNACATNLNDLNNYGTLTGVILSVFLLWVSKKMGVEFETLQTEGRKIGEEDEEELQKEMDLLAKEQGEVTAKILKSGDGISEDDEGLSTSCVEDADDKNSMSV